RRLSSEGVPTVDQDGGGAAKAHALSLLRRLDQLVENLLLEASLPQRFSEPLLGQLPVRAAVEVLEDDSHGFRGANIRFGVYVLRQPGDRNEEGQVSCVDRSA